MKKLFVFALAAVLSSFAFAAEPHTVMTEMSQRGNVTLMRTLDNKGMLTESVCKSSAQGTSRLNSCVSQSIKLSKQQVRDTALEMHSNQINLLASAPTGESGFQTESAIYSDQVARMSPVSTSTSGGISTSGSVSSYGGSVSHTKGQAATLRTTGSNNSESLGLNRSR